VSSIIIFNRLPPPVTILKSYDIILTQVTPGLDLNHLQWHLPWILKPMLYAKGDIGRLVFSKYQYLVTASYLGSPTNNDPMFGAMVVKLQRQAGTRI
jgi:hypothetical protein